MSLHHGVFRSLADGDPHHDEAKPQLPEDLEPLLFPSVTNWQFGGPPHCTAALQPLPPNPMPADYEEWKHIMETSARAQRLCTTSPHVTSACEIPGTPPGTALPPAAPWNRRQASHRLLSVGRRSPQGRPAPIRSSVPEENASVRPNGHGLHGKKKHGRMNTNGNSIAEIRTIDQRMA